MKNIALFLSSTFADMQSERDIIREKVTPELADAVRELGANVEFIDLRWGINTSGEDEKTSSQKIIYTCFDEIKRTDPYFVILLGERYGWVPPREDVIAALSAEKLGDDPAFENKSITEMEIAFAFHYYKNTDRCLFYFREPVDYGEDEKAKNLYVSHGEEREKLEALKTMIKASHPDKVFTYKASWNEKTQSIDGLSDFERDITKRISDLLVADHADSETRDPVKDSLTVHETFVDMASVGFAGRKNELAAMKNFVDGKNEALLVCGNSGSGKSKLLARFAKELSEKGVQCLSFFTNADNRSSTVESMLRLFVYKLFLLAGVKPPDDLVEYDEETLRKKFYELVNAASADRQLVIVVDAINQLARTESEYKLKWLNLYAMSSNVKVVMSCTTDYYQYDYARAVCDQRLDLDYFSSEDIRLVTEQFFRINHKEAIPEIVDAIAVKDGKNNPCRMPIYLLTLLQQLNNIGADDFKKIEQRKAAGEKADVAIVNYLTEMIRLSPPTVEKQLFALIETTKKKIGKDRCETIVSAIANSVYGMPENLLDDVSSCLGQKFQSAEFSYFRKLFRSNLIQRETGAWDFNHNLVKKYCKEYFANTGTEKFVIDAVCTVLDERPSDEIKNTEYARFCALAERTEKCAAYLDDAGEPAAKALVAEMQNPEISCDKWNGFFNDAGHSDSVREFLLGQLRAGSLSAKTSESFVNSALNLAYSQFKEDKIAKAQTALAFYVALGDLAVKYGYLGYAEDCLKMANDLNRIVGGNAMDTARILSKLSECCYMQGKTFAKNKYAKECRTLLKSALNSGDEAVARALVAQYYGECAKKAESFFRSSKYFDIRILGSEKILLETPLSEEGRDAISLFTVGMAALTPFRKKADCPKALATCRSNAEKDGFIGAENCFALSEYYGKKDAETSQRYVEEAQSKLRSSLLEEETPEKLKLYEKVLSSLVVINAAHKTDASELKRERASVLKKIIAQDFDYEYVRMYIDLASENKRGDVVSREELADAKSARKSLLRGNVSVEQKMVNKLFRLAVFIVFSFYFIIPQIPIAFFGNWVTDIFSTGGLARDVVSLYTNYLSAAFQGTINTCLCMCLYGVICFLQRGTEYRMKRAWLKRSAFFFVAMTVLTVLYAVMYYLLQQMLLSSVSPVSQVKYTYNIGMEFCLLMLLCAEFVEFTGKEYRFGSAVKEYSRFVLDFNKKITDTLVRAAFLVAVTVAYILLNNELQMIFMVMPNWMFIVFASVIAVAMTARIIRLVVLKHKAGKLYG